MTTFTQIQQFLEDLKIRNYAERTVTDYGYHLKYWVKYLIEKEIKDLRSVTVHHIADYQRWIYYQPTKRGGIRSVYNQNTILAVVKSFYRYLHREGIVEEDPAISVKLAREPERLPRVILTVKEANKIIDKVDTSKALGHRDRTMLEVFYSTGIRRNELRNLRMDHVNLDEGLLYVHEGKGGHSRVTPLTKQAKDYLRSYMRDTRPQLIKEKEVDKLFVSYRGKPIDQHSTGDIVKKHAKKAGVKKNITCHIWRHSVSVHLLKNNANLRHVQSLLGHKSLATTERYLQLSINDLKEAHRKFHPRENSF